MYRLFGYVVLSQEEHNMLLGSKARLKRACDEVADLSIASEVDHKLIEQLKVELKFANETKEKYREILDKFRKEI